MKKFSIENAEVIRQNDQFSNDEMSKILGGSAAMGCVCKCGTNTASMSNTSKDQQQDQFQEI